MFSEKNVSMSISNNSSNQTFKDIILKLVTVLRDLKFPQEFIREKSWKYFLEHEGVNVCITPKNISKKST